MVVALPGTTISATAELHQLSEWVLVGALMSGRIMAAEDSRACHDLSRSPQSRRRAPTLKNEFILVCFSPLLRCLRQSGTVHKNKVAAVHRACVAKCAGLTPHGVLLAVMYLLVCVADLNAKSARLQWRQLPLIEDSSSHVQLEFVVGKLMTNFFLGV